MVNTVLRQVAPHPNDVNRYLGVYFDSANYAKICFKVVMISIISEWKCGKIKNAPF